MTEEEMNKIVDMIVEQLFIRMEIKGREMSEEFIHDLPTDEEQIEELTLLLKYYERVEDYHRAANIFSAIQKLKNNE